MFTLNATTPPTTNARINTSAINGPPGSSSATLDSLVIINILIGSFGLVGNVFVIIVIVCFTSMHRQITNIFVINQSIVDAVSSLLILASQLIVVIQFRPILIPNQFASELYCRVWKSRLLHWGTYVSSIYNLVALTIERYLKVVHPILHKTSFTTRKAKILILFVWLFGVAFELAYGVPTSKLIGITCWSVSIWPNDVTNKIVGVLVIVVQYWLPLVVFIVAYTKMILIFRRSKIHNGLGIVFNFKISINFFIIIMIYFEN